jgi:hypothetical protein
MRISVSRTKIEHQLSVNNVWSSIFDNQGLLQPYDNIIIVLGAFISKNVINNITYAS